MCCQGNALHCLLKTEGGAQRKLFERNPDGLLSFEVHYSINIKQTNSNECTVVSVNTDIYKFIFMSKRKVCYWAWWVLSPLLIQFKGVILIVWFQNTFIKKICCSYKNLNPFYSGDLE